jgi:hypothetical protein
MNKKFVIPYSKFFSKNESMENLPGNKKDLKPYLELIDYNFVSDKQSNTFLYRGISNVHSNFIFINSMDYVRLPKDGTGMYNSWIDGSPDWKEYPKRSKSIITTTELNTAYIFGQKSYDTTFLILPLRENISKEILYGISPYGDMWNSFEEVLTQDYDLPSYYTISQLFEDLGLYFNLLLNKSPEEIKYPSFENLTNWLDELQSILDDPTPEQQNDIDELKRSNMDSGGLDIDVIYDILKDPSLLRSINKIMDPDSNGFELQNLDYITKNFQGKDSEIWYEGKAIGISISYMKEKFGKISNGFLTVETLLNFLNKN